MFVPAYASKVFLSMMTVAPCRQTGGPATYRLKDRQRIRQVSGREAISGLKAGFAYFSSTSLMVRVYWGVTILAMYMPVGTARP